MPLKYPLRSLCFTDEFYVINAKQKAPLGVWGYVCPRELLRRGGMTV